MHKAQKNKLQKHKIQNPKKVRSATKQNRNKIDKNL
jgi:hypothetical protein